jgi:putative addiction module CopG family antidote
MSVQLSDELRCFVKEQIDSGRYASEKDLLEHALRLLREREGVKPAPRPEPPEGGAQGTTPVGRKPIWEVAEERMGAVPDEELERLPADGAEHLDHYLYGTPKRTS